MEDAIIWYNNSSTTKNRKIIDVVKPHWIFINARILAVTMNRPIDDKGNFPPVYVCIDGNDYEILQYEKRDASNNENVLIPMTQHQINECMEALDLELIDRCCTQNEMDTVQDVYDYLAKFKKGGSNQDEN